MSRFFGWRVVAAGAVVLLLAGVGLGLGLPSHGSRSVASAAGTTQRIGMKVLLVTDSTDPSTASGIAYADWASTLKREGVPYDAWVTSSPMPSLSGTAPDGSPAASYEGVVVATSGIEGMSAAQWTALQTFEHDFSVRQVTAYASPSADQGLTAPSPTPLSNASPLTLTASGRQVFPYLNAVALDTGSFGYAATALAGANVDTLVSGPGNSTVVGVFTAPDGRQMLFQTFNENQFMLQSELLRHGELAWLARGTYFGDQRNYLETHIDDNFLADAGWSVAGNAATAPHTTDFSDASALRTVPADVTAAAAWSRANGFRLDMLFNGGGSLAVATGDTLVGVGDAGSGTGGTIGGDGASGPCSTATPCPDPLLAAYQGTDPATGRPYANSFAWISHTWDHPNIDGGCATQSYIQAELNQNTAWATRAAGTAGDAINGGLGLASSTDPAATLGANNPQVVVTGEHSGLANLIPGNPGQVDPPSLDDATATTGGTLPAGQYAYAVTDQFNTAAPGAPAAPAPGESAASISAPVTVGASGAVRLTWGAVCHAGQYNVYRAPVTGATPGAWSLIGTVAANTSTDFVNPSGNSTTNTAGGGPISKTFTDSGSTLTGSSGAPSAATRPSTEGAAIESAYEQNPALNAAFAGATGGGIKFFGADASKPYPRPADGSFQTGAYAGATYPAGAVFSDAGATGIPRYPTNIYYNVSTDAAEVDEFQTLYDLPTCTPIAGVTTCNPSGTQFTIGQIVANADLEMFQHMMGNDPRPHYFHESNLMTQSTGSVNSSGDGLFYRTMSPLLAQYHQYFAANAPIEQLTMPQIGALLAEQAAWAQAGGGQVTGSISGNVVTVANTGAAATIPLTGTTVGTPYAGSQSGWVVAPSGASTYTALAAWPQPPTGPVIVTIPGGSAPGAGGPLPGPAKPPATPIGTRAPGSVCTQARPVNVRVERGMKVTARLRCKAPPGRRFATGKLAVTVNRQTVTKAFRIRSGKTASVTVKLPKRARAAAANRKHPVLHAKLKVSTKQPRGKARVTRGKLKIVTAPPKRHAVTKAKR
ncbi:MAG TPA: hypothetical protein VGM91_06385 [Conexibacter sp.]|jgi:hypothetical protein